jgi:hypothetical protein
MSEVRQHRDSRQDSIPYADRLARDWRWALSEGSIFFEGRGEVYNTLHRIAARLNELKIPYAVVGGLAVFQHGVRRFTEDVDILVTREGLLQIHERLEGLGYVAPFEGSKNLRDVESGVKIEFLVSGGFPGDGKPKPIAFPDPAQAGIDRDGVRFINLDALLELKLASGMTGAGRQKDLADVVALIKVLHLQEDFGKRLNAYVGETYAELWKEAQAAENYERKDEREGWRDP